MFGLKLFKRPKLEQRSAVTPPPPAWPTATGAVAAGRRTSPPPPPPPEAFLAAQAPVIPAGLASGPPQPARVRFFYTDGTVSEPDPQEAERLGYLATNLLEASREDSP